MDNEIDEIIKKLASYHKDMKLINKYLTWIVVILSIVLFGKLLQLLIL